MEKSSVIYRVHLFINPEIEIEYLNWLKIHIGEMLELPGFITATMTRCETLGQESSTQQNDEVEWIVDYTLKTKTDLENYLNTYAPKMRNDGLVRFTGKFRAKRWILSDFQQFNGKG